MRLHKFLSAAGICSRRSAERRILEGAVTVNGRTVLELGTLVDPHTDRVEFQGQLVTLDQPRVYVALHKPKGVVTSCRHSGEKIVTDLVKLDYRLYPVGRLDKDSSGLLLLTNDGGLHHRLLHPSFDHEKTYEVTVAAAISDDDLKHLAEGVRLRDGMTRAAKVKRLSEVSFRIILQEGRNRQIRRMAQALGHKVKMLKRTRFAGIALGDLPVGKWRFLTREETTLLFLRVFPKGR